MLQLSLDGFVTICPVGVAYPCNDSLLADYLTAMAAILTCTTDYITEADANDRLYFR